MGADGKIMELMEFGKALIHAFNAKNLDLLLSFFDRNATYEFPGMPRLEGKQTIKKFLRMVFEEALSDMIITVRHIFICTNYIIIEWTNKATTPMGNPYSNLGVFIVELKDEKIQSFREYLDLTPTKLVAEELKTKK